MTPKQFYNSESRDVLKDVCKKAKTTVSNFQQIAVAGGSVSAKLAARLAEASGGKMTELEILYPERFESNPSEVA